MCYAPLRSKDGITPQLSVYARATGSDLSDDVCLHDHLGARLAHAVLVVVSSVLVVIGDVGGWGTRVLLESLAVLAGWVGTIVFNRGTGRAAAIVGIKARALPGARLDAPAAVITLRTPTEIVAVFRVDIVTSVVGHKHPARNRSMSVARVAHGTMQQG